MFANIRRTFNSIAHNNTGKFILYESMGSHTKAIQSLPFKSLYCSIVFFQFFMLQLLHGSCHESDAWGVLGPSVVLEGGVLPGSHEGTQCSVWNISVSPGGWIEVVILALEKGSVVEG